MREIKFRAWFRGDKENPMGMYRVVGIQYDGITIGSLFAKINEETQLEVPQYYLKVLRRDIELMQYTGLKDKNGKEIYEGDIIKTPEGIGQVFDRLSCWFVEMQKELGYFNTYDIEIIGNIYENPEDENKKIN